MREQQSFTVQSAVAVLLINGIVLGALYYLHIDVLFDRPTLFWAIGGVGTLVLWLVILWIGRRAIDAAGASLPAPTTAPPPPPPKVEPAPPVVEYKVPPEASALQILSILQRRGRLIDFLQEDLSGYDDAQIGAAVRTIHEGCREALQEHVPVEPIYNDPEGSQVAVQEGFDAHAVRLTGNVGGAPPFRGVLQHRGWRAVRVDLPETSQDEEALRVIAPAEVEVR